MNGQVFTCIDSCEVNDMRKQQLWTGLGAFTGMLVLILDGKTALEGAQQGVDLCLKTVIPSLFPFFLLSILLTGSILGTDLPLLRPIGKLFRIPNGAESILVSAILGGYPAGAQCVSEAYHSGQIRKTDAERMLAFCNNAGPAFLFGMVASAFPQKWMACSLWGIHLVSAFLVSRLFSASTEPMPLNRKAPVSLSAAMTSAVKVMACVCGWVILFRVLITFLNRWFLWLLPMEARTALTGLLELSNGCCELMAIKDLPARYIICSGLLAFGGLCVTMQTLSVAKELSLRQYFLGKLLQTVFSLILASAIVYQQWVFSAGLLLFFLLYPQKMRKKSGNPNPLGV